MLALCRSKQQHARQRERDEGKENQLIEKKKKTAKQLRLASKNKIRISRRNFLFLSFPSVSFWHLP